MQWNSNCFDAVQTPKHTIHDLTGTFTPFLWRYSSLSSPVSLSPAPSFHPSLGPDNAESQNPLSSSKENMIMLRQDC